MILYYFEILNFSQIIGNQGEDIWVFNDHIQMNRHGARIHDEEQVHVLMEDSVKLPQLPQISSDKRIIIYHKRVSSKKV